MKTKILLVYTGGTIGMVKDYENESLVPFDFENLLKHIPELKLIDCQIDYTGFDQPIDSSDLHPEHWIELAEIIELNYENYDGFVILHGTDTMAYSASALSFMLSGLQKPVIFTGSQLPVGDLRTDAKENLITSLHFASLQKEDRKSTRLNSSHVAISYAVFCLKKKNQITVRVPGLGIGRQNSLLLC